jgi:GntR family transcriptional regulator
VIDPRRGEPAHRQLADALRAQIGRGELRPGDRLPTELQLGQAAGVGRSTVRRAVAALRAEGLITVDRGHGTRVRRSPPLEDVVLPPGSTAIARMPTPEERVDHDVPEGVPILVVVGPDGLGDVYPADRVRITRPS